MVDIAKFQGTGIDKIARIWGISIASILKIIGITVPNGGGTNITAGTSAVFESASSDGISAAMLSETSAIVCYKDGGNSNKSTACVLSISDMTITAGTPVVFENSNVAYISVAMLSSTLAIVCYRDYGNSYYGTACCLSISGTTITVGEQAVFESASTTDISVAMLTSTKAIVCYSDSVNLGYGTACCLSVSGTTITAGTPAVFSSSGSYVFSVGMLTSTLAIACYTDDDNSGYGTACCLSVSGTTITAGTPVVFENASSDYISVAILSSTLAIVCYRDGGNSSHGTACCLSVSGTTITAGTPTVFYNANTAYISVAMLSPSLAIVCYKDGGSTNSYGTARCLSISGTTITSRTPVVFESAYTDNISVGMLTSTKAIACYKDGGNSNHGTANIMTIS